MSKFQRIVLYFFAFGSGALFAGQIFDALGNARSQVGMLGTVFWTIVVAILWIATTFFLKLAKPSWITKTGKIWVKGVGTGATIFIAGAVSLMWIAQILNFLEPLFQLKLGDKTQLAQVATQKQFEVDLADAQADMAQKARAYFSAAELDFNDEHYQDATNNYQKSISIIPTLAAHLNISNSLIYLAKYEDAQKNIESGLRISRSRADGRMEGAFLVNMGHIYRDTGKPDSALNSYKTALDVANKAGDTLLRGNALHGLSTVYQDQARLEEGLQASLASLKSFEDMNNQIGMAIAHSKAGNCLADQGKNEPAKSHFYEALRIYKQVGSLRGQATVFNDIANLDSDGGRFKEALKNYQESLNISRQLGSLRIQAATLGNAAICYFELGEREKAIESWNDAANIYNQINSTIGRASILQNLGAAYKATGRLDDALKSLEDSLELHRQMDNQDGIAGSYINIADIYQKKGEPNKALEMGQNAVIICKSRCTELNKSLSYQATADVYVELGDYDSAFKNCKQSLAIAENIGAKDTQGYGLMIIAQIQLKEYKLQEALDTVQTALAILSSVEGQVEANLSKGEILYYMGKFQDSLTHYNKAKELNEHQSDSWRQARVLGSSGITYLKMGNKTKAQVLLAEACTICSNVGLKERYCRKYCAAITRRS